MRFLIMLRLSALACILVLQSSAVGGQATTVASPSPDPQPNGTGVQPPVSILPAPGPQEAKPLPPSVWRSPSTLPLNPFVPPPTDSNDSVPPSAVEAPSPVTTPSNSSPPIKQIHPPVPESAPSNTHRAKPPVSDFPWIENPPVTRTDSPPPLPPPVFPRGPPSPPPDVLKHPTFPGNPFPVKPIPSESPTSLPVGIFAPPPSTNKKMTTMPAATPARGTAHHKGPVHHFPAEAPSASKPMGHPSNAPPPQLVFKSRPAFHYPSEHHHAKIYRNTPPPLSHMIPSTSGSPPSPSFPSTDDAGSPMSPSASPLQQPKLISPKRPPPLIQALPPPPPHTDCASLTCQEPLAYGPPESPCTCVLPIQVGIRLEVSLYTFFPLVSELASEIAAGVFLKQSQVRIMGANAAEDDPDKTISHIDLLPLERKFADTTAHLIYQRFWTKKVTIKTSFFGAYDVLYVRYPGLPPSPPLPPSAVGRIIPSKPYPGRDNKTRAIEPLGVDISREQHKHGPNGSMLAAIIASSLVTVILLCAVIWVFVFRHKLCSFQPDPIPTSTIRSLAKSSGIPMSMVGSGPTSPAFSLVSSIAAFTGSARTFSSSDIERATNSFNETQVIGEGGFGRVYSGVLDDGTKVAIKILKRYDQQGGREFLAEVEMLSRLHHRNLVKLIGICVEDRAHCLVYELIPNGSVESHLHGVDKERAPLDWSTRLKIALGAARGLAYLHEDSCPRVIHRDFKASNILLDDDFTPKVSDFGLARAALDEENQHISTRVMGTFGYLAPEYAMTGHLLVKSDVYSYGVVLLELLTGRKPVDMSQPPGQENLVSWARPLLTNQQSLETIIDPSLGSPFDSIAKVAAIASMCVQPEVSQRPFMGEVVQALRLVSDESRGSSHEDLSMMMAGGGQNSGRSDQLVEALLTPSSDGDYTYGYHLDDDDARSEVSLSELLSSAAAPGPGPGPVPGVGPGSGSFRRYGSSSGPIGRTGKRKAMWKAVRRLSRGNSAGESGMLVRLWPGSH